MSDINELMIKKASEDALTSIFENDKDVESIDIDYLIHDVLIIKAESLKDKTIYGYADYLEKQLMKIKKGDAVLEL